MVTNKDILLELQELDEQRNRIETAVKTNGDYNIELLRGLTVYIDENFDKTPLVKKLYTLKHKVACAKLELVNARIKFLNKQLK